MLQYVKCYGNKELGHQADLEGPEWILTEVKVKLILESSSHLNNRSYADKKENSRQTEPEC